MNNDCENEKDQVNYKNNVMMILPRIYLLCWH